MSEDIIVPFAKTNFRNRETVFGIKTDDRRRHMYVIGKTGMGKTNLLENLAIQDIRNGQGMCFVDPHGDTAEKIITMIPEHRLDDVIYFNPGDQDFPISFNVMEQVEPKFRPLVASGLIGVFQKLWADSWGPRLEYILRNAILALLEYPGSTLLGVMRILVDKPYRIDVINHVTDPVVKAFWVDEFSKWNDRVLQEVISPIQNKVGQFLTSPLIRNVVGQETSAFSVREAMDSNKILIMNLAKGRIGEDNAALLGAMMITKIQLAAMARVDTVEDERQDFYLYVDEFQNFATESFANILSEARKYRLSLILANQYIAQLEEEVRDAIFGNVGTIASFRIGAADAEYMEKEFEPVFMMNDIVNLQKYHIYIKLMIDGIAGDAFSATTLPPVTQLEADSTQAVIAASRAKYASDIVSVEKTIMDWSGMASPAMAPAPVKKRTPEASPSRKVEGSSPAVTQSKAESAVQQSAPEKAHDDRELHDATCSECGLKISVPFKPDGSRPVYCKDCLKEHQRTTAKNTTTPTPRKQGVAKSESARQPNRVSKSEESQSVADAVYEPLDKPMSLDKMTNIAPKKFIKKTRQQPDSQGIKDLIRNARNS